MKKIVSLILVCIMALSLMMTANAEIALKAEKPELNILLYNVTITPEDRPEYKVVEEVTGYKTHFNVLPSENASEVLMLTLSGSNDYDMAVIQDAGQFNTLMTSHAILPLNDYIDAIAPELWDIVSPETWKGVSDDEGNVYALPFINVLPKEITSCITVRMDLVKAAGIEELPTTISEFYDFCKKLQEFYGDQYIILAGPYNKGTFGNTYNIPMCIASAFGIYSDWMTDDDGNVIYMTEHKNFGDMIAFLNKLYSEGILDVDYAINTWSTADEKMSSGRAIMEINSRESINPMSAALYENNPGVTEDDINWLPLLHSDDGKAVFMENNSYWSYTVVPANKAENAADVVNFAAKKVANEQLILIGEEGTHFSFDEEGIPTPILPIFTDERNASNHFMNMVKASEVSMLWSARLRKSTIMWKLYNTVTLEAQKTDPNMMIVNPFAFNNKSEYAEYNALLFSDLNVYLTQLVTGVKNIDDSMSTFMNDWKVNGGEEVRSALTDWVQAK